MNVQPNFWDVGETDVGGNDGKEEAVSDGMFTMKREILGLSDIPSDVLQEELLLRAFHRVGAQIQQAEAGLKRMREKQTARMIELGRIVQRRNGGGR